MLVPVITIAAILVVFGFVGLYLLRNYTPTNSRTFTSQKSPRPNGSCRFFDQEFLDFDFNKERNKLTDFKKKNPTSTTDPEQVKSKLDDLEKAYTSTARLCQLQDWEAADRAYSVFLDKYNMFNKANDTLMEKTSVLKKDKGQTTHDFEKRRHVIFSKI